MGSVDDSHSGDISKWTFDNVALWFRDKGLQNIESSSMRTFEIDGSRVLALSRDDLARDPFNITDLNEIDHIMSSIENLRNNQIKIYMKTYEANGHANGVSNGFAQSYATQNGWGKHHKGYKNGYANGHIANNEDYSITIPLMSEDHNPSPNRLSPTSSVTTEQFPAEKIKTLVATGYMFFGFIVSVLMLQFVHERVPTTDEDMPLPDVFFDIIPKRVEWAFDVCEINGMILTAFALLVAFFHKHKSIVLRRVFFILGTLYLYRSLTMWVTTLPVPGMHFKCAPKVHGRIGVMIHRASSLFIGGGLSVTGAHQLCGDYLFSGHTVILVITYVAIYEYTPKRLWWFHWLCWLLSATGIICILLAHDHYTIDVVVAYLLTTRLFWGYHTMANIQALKETSVPNLLSRVWWFPMFRYLEGNITGGQLPKHYEWPLPWPRFLKDNRRVLIKGV